MAIQMDGTYLSLPVLDDGCEGYVTAEPPGYLLERIDNVVINGDTVVNLTIYSDKAWLSGSVFDGVTDGALSGAVTPSVTAYRSTGQDYGADVSGSSYNFRGTPGHPRVSGGLPVTRPPGVENGPGSETYTLKVTATGYPDYESPPVTLTSGAIQTRNISLYANSEDTDMGPCGRRRGGGSQCENNAGRPINTTNGNAWVQHRDYTLPGLGGGLALVRTWNSRGHNFPGETSGMFGDRWRSTYEERLTLPRSDVRKYWRSDGSAWLFKYDSASNSHTLVVPPDERASLVFNTGTNQFTLTFLDGTQSIFRSDGYLIALKDRNGNTTSVTYDGSNRITQVTDPAGRSISFTYVGSSTRAASTQDATGGIANYTYAGNKLERVDYVGDTSALDYVYDASSRLAEVRDANHVLIERFTYDGSGRATGSELANGVDKVTVDYSFPGLVRLTNSRLFVTEYRYGEIAGRRYIYGISGPGCSSCGGRGTQTFTYDPQGNRTSLTDALGRTTTYTYDAQGNVLSRSITGAGIALIWRWTYNSFGQVLTATDPLGNVTTNTYDSKGNLLSTSTPSPDGIQPGSTTTFRYDPLGQLTRVTDPRNNPTTFTYWPAGLLETVTDALNNVTRFEYDARGNRTAVVDALNNRTTFEYDLRARLKKITYPDLSTTRFGYDIRGRRTAVTDANNKTTTYGYDDADRLTSVTDAANSFTRYAYDTESNLTSITDAMTPGRVTSFAYDADNRVTQVTFPSTLTEAYTYDAVGNLLTKRDRKNQTISYTYDFLNRLTRKQYPLGGGVDYTYDNLSRLTRVVDSTGTYEFTYDNMSRLTQPRTTYSFLSGRTFTVSYGYDPASNRTSMTDAEGGVANYVYDQLNRLTSLTHLGQPFTFGYDALSRRTLLTRQNNVNTTYSYDSLSRLLSVLHKLGATTLDGATYTVDPVGNRTSKKDERTGKTSNYTYDAIYELTQVQQGIPTTEAYTYDPVGNRLSSLGVSPYVYNSSNQLISTPGVTYTYDNNGNLTSKTPAAGIPTSYAWDFDNRLTSVTQGTAVTSFAYDPFGRRIRSISANGTIIYVHDGANIIEEVDAAGAVLARYTQGLGIDEPLAQLRAGTINYYEADGLGSITSLSNSSGALANTYTYDSFGNLTASSGTITNPFRYTAREFDSETSLHFYRARHYNQSIGRFLSEDPLGFIAGMNFYDYVNNNPVNYSDPYGHQVGPIPFPVVVVNPVVLVTVTVAVLVATNPEVQRALRDLARDIADALRRLPRCETRVVCKLVGEFIRDARWKVCLYECTDGKMRALRWPVLSQCPDGFQPPL